MSGSLGLGEFSPIPFVQQSQGNVFADMLAALQAIQGRLAPPPAHQRITFNNIAPGSQAMVETVNSNTFNALLVSISAGQVNFWFGSDALNVPDLQLGASPTPYLLPFDAQGCQQVTMQAGGTAPAYGTVTLVQY